MEKPAILIVDDRQENLLVLERLLQPTGAHLVRAFSGNEALKACLNQEFALALLDVNMPEMNGYELAELMRGEKSLSAIPIIFLTAAYREQQQIFEGYSCGAVDYLVKPLQAEILLNKVAVFLDIDRQKQQLRRRGEELERLNRELARAKEAAVEATRAKSSFLGDMSHEVRNPLNCINGMTQVLLESGLNDEQRGYAEMILKSSDHLLELVNDSLDLARIEAGRLRFESSAFDLRDALTEVSLLLHQSAAQKGIALNLDIESRVPDTVHGDPGRLRQLVTNLVSNAIRYTREGEVKIAVSLVTEDEHAQHLRFMIRDTGCGIAEPHLTTIFEPFTQLSHAEERSGSGLGLAICKKLVTLFNGEIGVESRAGEGSTFWFTAEFPKLSSRGPLHQPTGTAP